MGRAIAAELVNHEGRPEVRRSNDGRLTLRLTNATSSPLGTTLIQLSLAPLLGDPATQADLTVSAPKGWSAAYNAANEAWGLHPPAGFMLTVGEPLLVHIAGVSPTIPVGEALLTVVVTGGDEALTRLTVPLMVLPGGRPGERDLADALGVRLATRLTGGGVGNPEVAVSRRTDDPERSDLLLALYNRTGAPLVEGEWGPWPPTLTLVFDTADGPPGHYALTTAKRLDDIEVFVEAGTGWRVVKRSPGPEWDIVAVPVEGRHEVLAPGEFAEISIRGVTTDFAPGPTLVELRSHGFPGFTDVVRTFVVDKRSAPMRIAEPLDANAVSVDLSPDGTATVELTWNVEHASLVQLSGVGEVPLASDGYEVTVTRDTAFVLTAYDAMLGEILTDRIAITTRMPAGERTAALPRGAIVAWTGDSVPDGYALCDGSADGVPDLRGRFIVGAGAGFGPGEHGGGGAHRHTFPGAAVQATVEPEGGHAHAPPPEWNGVRLKRGFLGFGENQVLTAPAEDVQSDRSGEVAPHDHTLEPLALELAIDDGEHWPPWFALAYIMKL